MVKKNEKEKVSIFARRDNELVNSESRASRSTEVHHNEDLADLETQNSAKEDLADGDIDTQERTNRVNPEQTQATIKVDHLLKSRASSRFLDDPDIANFTSLPDLDIDRARMNDTFDNAPSSKNITNGPVLTSNYMKKDVELSTTRGHLE